MVLKKLLESQEKLGEIKYLTKKKTFIFICLFQVIKTFYFEQKKFLTLLWKLYQTHDIILG